MHKLVAIGCGLLVAVGVVVGVAPAATAAGNDDPANAQVIDPLDDKVPFTSSSSLSIPASGCTTDRPTEWFTFTPSTGGYWWLASGRAAAIDVYTGTAGSLTRLGCGSDVVNGGGSKGNTNLIVDLNAGTNYFIAVNVGRNANGSLNLNPLEDPVGATSVPLGDGPSAPSIELGGIFTPAP